MAVSDSGRIPRAQHRLALCDRAGRGEQLNEEPWQGTGGLKFGYNHLATAYDR
jgi:hypothetical protein